MEKTRYKIFIYPLGSAKTALTLFRVEILQKLDKSFWKGKIFFFSKDRNLYLFSKAVTYKPKAVLNPRITARSHFGNISYFVSQWNSLDFLTKRLMCWLISFTSMAISCTHLKLWARLESVKYFYQSFFSLGILKLLLTLS